MQGGCPCWFWVLGLVELEFMGWAFAWFKALGFGCWELGAGLWAKGEGLEQKDWVQVKEF